MKNSIYLSAILVTVFAFTSCNGVDVPAPVKEQEVITTVRTVLKNALQTVTLVSTDLDGTGPNAPVVTVSGDLLVNTTYTGTVEFLNEIPFPTVDITQEIKTEAVDHQVFFQAPAAIGSFEYNDLDSNGKPLGLKFTLFTTTSGIGNLILTLKHKPNKSGVGVATGNITNAGGNTDAQAIYPIKVQ